ncbi:MAG TPA: hypothetical protein VF240_00460 [Pyrinomonadaceae bacterium]
MADDPIIVRGGSVAVDLSDKFKDNGSGGGRKKYKNQNGRLLSVQINNETPRTLNPGDTITIVTDDGVGSGTP